MPEVDDTNEPVPEVAQVNTTASSEKIVDVDEGESLDTFPGISGFYLLDMAVLNEVFSIVSCPECHGTNCLSLTDIGEKKKGLAHFINLSCSFCLYYHQFYTSRKVENIATSTTTTKKTRGPKVMEVNLRMVYGCRAVGVGHASMTKLCGHLNMPPPMSSENYDNLSQSLKVVAKEVAEKSMSDAGADLRGDAETADVGVFVDGTWQRKGFTSTLGVVSAISAKNGKILDVCIMSKSCKGCTRMKSIEKSDPQQYNKWKSVHVCNQNYIGSSPNMEKVGAITIFGRSLERHNLYYTTFYGDGDSKAYPAVKDTYGPYKLMYKLECIGHYQKRVGNRLRKLKKAKKLGGKGKLTDAIIDKLQNYFGIALRSHVGNLDAMVNGCMASLYHVSDYHEKCPKSSNTWCQYQKDKIEGTQLYKSKGGFPLICVRPSCPFIVTCASQKIL